MARGQRFRNNAKREFNRYWGSRHGGKRKQRFGPERERRCMDCKNRDICGLYGKADHPSCFEPENRYFIHHGETTERGIIAAVWAAILFLIFAILGTTK